MNSLQYRVFERDENLNGSITENSIQWCLRKEIYTYLQGHGDKNGKKGTFDIDISKQLIKRIRLPKTHHCFHCQASDIDARFVADADFEHRRLV